MQFPDDFPDLKTPRLRLRAFTAADAAAVRQLASAKEIADVTATIPHPYPDGLAEEWIATHEPEWRARRQLILAVTVRTDGVLAGTIGLTFNLKHARAEMGYWLGLPFWGRGYTTEAAAGMMDYAFNVLGLNRVQAHHFARNEASGRVLLKAGMQREGASPQFLQKNDRFEDVVFYGVLRQAWKKGATANLPS